MLEIRSPSHTFKTDVAGLREFQVSHLVYGASIHEDRARAAAMALDESDVEMHRIDLLDEARLSVGGRVRDLNLYESRDLREFLAGLDGRIALDLTSLEHRVWAPLVRCAVMDRLNFVALYAEPKEYRRYDTQDGAVYDLSSTRGIEPLPGFARLGARVDDNGAFAPLLGFEGARLKHIFDQEEVDARLTSPVIGLPGFRLEYSMHSYIANRDIVDMDRMENRVEFAAASCPFEAYRALERIHRRTGSGHLRVAPIGTKPHALGAVLYALDNPTSVELIYDHPVRTTNRTEGYGAMYVYDVSGFTEAHGVAP